MMQVLGVFLAVLFLGLLLYGLWVVVQICAEADGWESPQSITFGDSDLCQHRHEIDEGLPR